MRSGPQTSSAVTVRDPSPRRDTIALILPSQKAKEAAQTRHPCLRGPKTLSLTQLHLHKQSPTTTALHPQTPQLPNSSTVAQKQHKTLLPLALQLHLHQTRDTTRLLPQSMLHLHQIYIPNQGKTTPRLPIPQRLLLWLSQCPSLTTRSNQTPANLQELLQQKLLDPLQPQNLTQKPQSQPPPPHLHHTPSQPLVAWRALQSLRVLFLALPL